MGVGNTKNEGGGGRFKNTFRPPPQFPQAKLVVR
jgi:hypothetical protein